MGPVCWQPLAALEFEQAMACIAQWGIQKKTAGVAAMTHAFASTLKTFKTASGKTGQFYSLPALAKQFPKIARLPVSMRIVLESVLRNCDGAKVTADHVR
eukprot:gene5133-6548_t